METDGAREGDLADLTVLFATHNGAETLPRMLDALNNLDAPGEHVKIVAVDNASTDGSADLIRANSRKLNITLLSEVRLGKNIALNKGLSEIEGDLVVLTDDDTVPRRDWLVSIRRIAEEQPNYDIFGGAIYPLWDEKPADWILRCFPKAYFTWTDLDEGPIEPVYVWGCNMTVRSKVFKTHRFLEGIGPDGTAKYATGSETEFTRRAATSGHLCWHSRDCVVGHIVRAHQIKPEWLLQRAYNQAKGWRRMNTIHNLKDRSAVTVAIKFCGATFGLARACVFGSFEDRLRAKVRLRALQGELNELWFSAESITARWFAGQWKR